MTQKLILVGNVGSDPEVRHFEGGNIVANFSLATSEKYKNKEGETVTETEWHKIVVWKGLAEIAEKYVKKGNLLYIEGKLKSRSWNDKDGVKRYSTDVIADTMRMLPGGNKTTEKESTTEPKQESDGDLPF